MPDTENLPKLVDVARWAGVSPATASRVLTGSARVRPETRQRVEAAIVGLGYVRNRVRQGAGTRRTGSVALVVCESNSRMFAEPFFLQMLRGVSRKLSARAIQPVLLTVNTPRDYRIAARYLRGGHVDGAVVVSMHGGCPLDPRLLGVAVVLGGRPLVGADDVSYVDADNVGGAMTAVRYLIEGGRTRIATIAGPRDMAPGVDRLRGYHAAMTAAELTDTGLVGFGDFGSASAEHALYRLLDRRPKLDAVFAASDLMAAGALRALRRTGRRVPDDVAVIGFEDSRLAQRTSPRLTTVRQPVEAMGERMADELLALIACGGTPPAHVLFRTELVIRESA